MRDAFGEMFITFQIPAMRDAFKRSDFCSRKYLCAKILRLNTFLEHATPWMFLRGQPVALKKEAVRKVRNIGGTVHYKSTNENSRRTNIYVRDKLPQVVYINP